MKITKLFSVTGLAVKKSGKAIALITFVLAIFVITASAATFTVTKTADTNDGFCDADCSLREAVAAANAAAGTDNIIFDATVFNTMQIITLTSGNLVITNSVNSSVTITGPGANLLTVSGNNTSKIFTILETPVVTISRMTLTQGNGVGTSPGNNFGGAVYNQGDLTLNNVVVTNSSATNEGGGIYVSTGDSLGVNNSTISNNSADSHGGGVYGHSGATVSISNSTVSDNTSDFDGGGLYIQGTAAVTDSTFSGNTAARNGGGAYAEDNAVLSVTNSTFSENTAQTPSAEAGGGGLYIDSADFTMTDSTVRDNISNLNGGGIAFDVLSFATAYTITGSTISGNTATNNGGGIFVENTLLTLTDSTISGNSAANGGGIYFFFNSVGFDTFTRLTISDNTATTSGGGIFLEDSDMTLTDSTVSGNTAAQNGGGAYADDNAALTVTNSTFSGNTAQATSANGGGGIYIDSAIFNMTDSTVRNNISNLNGGGIYFVNVLGILLQGTITGSTISGNTAANNGGGMFVNNIGLQTSNSTISGNSAANGGGIHYIDTSLQEFTLSYSTIARNNATTTGGGVSVTNQPINGNNTIFGNNTAVTAPDYNGALNSQSYNLIENTTGATITGNTTGNITGQDPLLDALANYGGPTETHRLMPGSPAIDAANPMSFPPTDQRGVMRPINGNNSGGAEPDIGSFEAVAPTAASVTISGRVSEGFKGIPRATVVLTDVEGNSRRIDTNYLGDFRFEEVAAGQTYIVEVFSKQYRFNPQVIFAGEDFSDLNFIGVRLTKPRRL